MNDIKNRICFGFIIPGIIILCASNGSGKHLVHSEKENAHPKIVNIINFIRLPEPRDSAVTEQVLYETVPHIRASMSLSIHRTIKKLA